jgi:uncharacterized protein (DUF362 family)
MTTFNRRNFLRTSLIGGVAATCIRPFDTFASIGSVVSGQEQIVSPRVSLTTGDSRADIAFRALQPFSKQIAEAVGKRRVVIKPNFVSTQIQLAATHADTLEGVLEFFKSIGKLGNLIIAESAGSGPSAEGYSNFGYSRLSSKYSIKLTDLDQEGSDVMYVFDEKDFRPHKIRMSHVLLDPDSYVVSVAKLKTHDRAVATLSLKNIVFGAPIKDPGFAWSPSRKPGALSDKPIAHGSGFRGIHYNLYTLSHQLSPDLSVIDGFEGMEGNGPISGTSVDHRVCVASNDWFAADRVGVELMGIDFAKMGYLNFCAQTGTSTADLSKIEIIGESINNHKKTYKLADNINDQLTWMKPVS